MRGVSRRFTATMKAKLSEGYEVGRRGWDTGFKGWKTEPTGFLMKRLREEVLELTLAAHDGDPAQIRSEAADVANFAMFIHDAHDGAK